MCVCTAADACAHYITIDRGQSAVDSVFFLHGRQNRFKGLSNQQAARPPSM